MMPACDRAQPDWFFRHNRYFHEQCRQWQTNLFMGIYTERYRQWLEARGKQQNGDGVGDGGDADADVVVERTEAAKAPEEDGPKPLVVQQTSDAALALEDHPEDSVLCPSSPLSGPLLLSDSI